MEVFHGKIGVCAHEGKRDCPSESSVSRGTVPSNVASYSLSLGRDVSKMAITSLAVLARMSASQRHPGAQVSVWPTHWLLWINILAL